jgi:hypothetical protein
MKQETKSASSVTADRCSVDRFVRPLGKLQRWWLRQFGETGILCVDIGGYAGTPYGKALVGLIDRKIIEPHPTHAAMGVVRLTEAGKRAWNNIRDHAEIQFASNVPAHRQPEEKP